MNKDKVWVATVDLRGSSTIQYVGYTEEEVIKQLVAFVAEWAHERPTETHLDIIEHLWREEFKKAIHAYFNRSEEWCTVASYEPGLSDEDKTQLQKATSSPFLWYGVEKKPSGNYKAHFLLAQNHEEAAERMQREIGSSEIYYLRNQPWGSYKV